MTFNPSHRAKNLKQSGIRSASLKCNEIGGINLGQGICDLPVPESIRQYTQEKIEEGFNTYSDCQGVMPLREKLAEKITQFNKTPTQASEVLIGHGSTGAFTCAAMTLFNPGDEVILFEPFYGYHRHVLQIIGVDIQTVPIDVKTQILDFERIKKTITKKTKGMVICTPCNPSGKVFTKEELIALGQLATENDLFILTDEIYEYITYPGHEHISLASLNDFKQRCVTLSGFSKTYNMTGWRLGYASGPEEVIHKMSLVQDFLYVCPSTPLQHGVTAALELPQSYYDDMKNMYQKKRDFVVQSLREIGFILSEPQGAYYLMADFSNFSFKDDHEAVDQLLRQTKVATVTGRSFYKNPTDGQNMVRFCYATNQEKLAQAMKQLKLLKKA